MHRLVSSMDRILDSRNVESMRKMMLMQEQVFKQQVQELHRLYNRQKKLMSENRNGLKETRTAAAVAERSTNNCYSARDDPSGSNSGGESSRRLINFDLQMPTRSTFRHFEEETDPEVDLTLSIGHTTTKQRSKNTQFTQRNEFRSIGSSSDKGEECIVSSSSNCARPRWLNRT